MKEMRLYLFQTSAGPHLAGAILLGDSHLAGRVKKAVKASRTFSSWLSVATTPNDILAALER